MRWLLLLLPLLAACGGPAEQSKVKPAARAAAAEKRLQEGPTARTHAVRGGELLVIEVPVKDFTGSVDSQRCYVWRDQEFKSSSISCNPQPEVVLAN